MLLPNKMLKPLIKWSGGKYDELRHILPHLPEYETYLEPFIGGGALFFRIAPEKAVISDVHEELIDFYKSIQNGEARSIHDFMNEHGNEESVYYNVRGMKPTCQLEVAQRFYYLRKTCYRGMLRYNKSGGFNVPYGRYKTISYDSLLEPAYEALLKRTTILLSGFETIFQTYNSPSNFMFLDPPYDSEFTDYGYCSFGKEEHKLLAECFKSTRIKCLMVISKTQFIEDLYKDYIVDEYDKKYRFKLHSNRVGSEINNKHLIIKNYT